MFCERAVGESRRNLFARDVAPRANLRKNLYSYQLKLLSINNNDPIIYLFCKTTKSNIHEGHYKTTRRRAAKAQGNNSTQTTTTMKVSRHLLNWLQYVLSRGGDGDGNGKRHRQQRTAAAVAPSISSGRSSSWGQFRLRCTALLSSGISRCNNDNGRSGSVRVE